MPKSYQDLKWELNECIEARRQNDFTFAALSKEKLQAGAEAVYKKEARILEAMLDQVFSGNRLLQRQLREKVEKEMGGASKSGAGRRRRRKSRRRRKRKRRKKTRKSNIRR